VEITFLQYLFEKRLPELPQPIAEALAAFEQDMAIIAQAMSDEVAGKVSTVTSDIQESAQRLRRKTQDQYRVSGSPIPPPLADMIALTQNLASILAPLYLDIHTPFTNPQQMASHHPESN
jgi:hypothetical protein